MAKTKKNPRILEECEDFLWSEWRDLNPRPLGPEPSALPTALHPDSRWTRKGSFPPLSTAHSIISNFSSIVNPKFAFSTKRILKSMRHRGSLTEGRSSKGTHSALAVLDGRVQNRPIPCNSDQVSRRLKQKIWFQLKNRQTRWQCSSISWKLYPWIKGS